MPKKTRTTTAVPSEPREARQVLTMSSPSGGLLRFVGELRAAQVPVSVAETLDAMRAVAAGGLADRVRVREALAAALIKDEADRPSFDEVFARFFGAGA